MYRLGRALQLIGMCLLPIAMAGNIMDQQMMPLGRMLMLTCVGVVVFTIGRSIADTSQGK